MGIWLAGCGSIEIRDRPGPTTYPDDAWPIVSAFGAATNPGGTRRPEAHNGVDIAAPLGTPVHAAEHGFVVQIKTPPGMGGNVIHQMTTETGPRLQLRYAHLDQVFVEENQEVVAGEVIGTVGKTGDWVAENEAPHLHFAVLDWEGRLDPEPFLRTQTGRVDCVRPGASYGKERFAEVRASRRDGAALLYPVACVR